MDRQHHETDGRGLLGTALLPAPANERPFRDESRARAAPDRRAKDDQVRPRADQARLRSPEGHETEARVGASGGPRAPAETKPAGVAQFYALPRIVQAHPHWVDRGRAETAQCLRAAVAPLPQDDRSEQAIRDGPVAHPFRHVDQKSWVTRSISRFTSRP